jgi:zinc and cadmium transporter
MAPGVLLAIYCLLILLASLAGGWIPLMIRLTHRRMQVAISLVAGVMLGVGLLHMLPHALAEARGGPGAVFAWTLAGFLTMFFLERFFCYHHHEVPQLAHAEHAAEPQIDAPLQLQSTGAAQNQAMKRPSYGDEHEDSGRHVYGDAHRLTWTGAMVGLTLHTIINGIALAASVEVASRSGQLGTLAGVGTFLVIFLHKPFDAMSIGTLMAVGGWSRSARHCVNGLFALMIPAGVVLFYIGLGQVQDESNLVAYAVAFAAGTFLCIAMSDLLPELQFHAHDRAALSVALLLGLSVAWAISAVESRGHGHEHAGRPTGVQSDEHDAELEVLHEHEDSSVPP